MANEIIKGMGFHHVALKAADYEGAYKFYTEGLGMKLYATWGEGDTRAAMLDLGDGGILELFAGGTKETEANARFIHFAMKVDDVDTAYEIALKAGAKPKSAPVVVPGGASPVKLTLNCAFVYGPCGEELEFFRIVSAE